MCLFFRLSVEIARLFLSELTVEDIKSIQTSLSALGFTTSSELIFDKWKKERSKLRELQAQTGAPAVKGKTKKGQVS